VKPETRLAALIISENKAGVFETHRAEIAQLARLDADALHIAPALKAIPDKAVSLVQAAATIYLPLAQLVDLQAERARLDRELADTQMHIARSEGLLSGDFATKAPGPVVQKERDKLAALQEKQARLAEQIEALR
jgi:valyl-tRNA synthetase